MIGISGTLIWSKTLMELIFNPCGEFRWSPESPVSQIRSPHLQAGAPGIFSDLLRSVPMLKSERCAPHLFIPSKTAPLVPEFAVEDLPLGKTLMIHINYLKINRWHYSSEEPRPTEEVSTDSVIPQSSFNFLNRILLLLIINLATLLCSRGWVDPVPDLIDYFQKNFIIIVRVFYPRIGPSLQGQEPRLQFCRRQVFHQGCSFTRDWIGVVGFRTPLFL